MPGAAPSCRNPSSVDHRRSWAAPLAIAPVEACRHPAAGRGCISAVVRFIFWAKPPPREKTGTYGAAGTARCHSPTPIRHRGASRALGVKARPSTCGPENRGTARAPRSRRTFACVDSFEARRPSIGAAAAGPRLGRRARRHRRHVEPGGHAAAGSGARRYLRIATPIGETRATRDGMIECGEAGPPRLRSPAGVNYAPDIRLTQLPRSSWRPSVPYEDWMSRRGTRTGPSTRRGVGRRSGLRQPVQTAWRARLSRRYSSPVSTITIASRMLRAIISIEGCR